ncbi:hypothetical protein TNCV_841061 [Trichonephila clavipes]|nr:hypothetical protein TNCV_841061 [Trichonephila clavipes]
MVKQLFTFQGVRAVTDLTCIGSSVLLVISGTRTRTHDMTEATRPNDPSRPICKGKFNAVYVTQEATASDWKKLAAPSDNEGRPTGQWIEFSEDEQKSRRWVGKRWEKGTLHFEKIGRHSRREESLGTSYTGDCSLSLSSFLSLSLSGYRYNQRWGSEELSAAVHHTLAFTTCRYHLLTNHLAAYWLRLAARHRR